MKKIYLSLLIICLGFISNAQVKMYEYPSGSLNEEMINNIIEDSRQSGTQQWELDRLRANLTARMQMQKSGSRTKARGVNPQVQSACTNVDFENGSYSGWTLTSGDINYVNLPCNSCATGAGGIANVTTASNTGPCWTSGIDDCTGQPAVAPGGGVYSLCLNDKSAGGKMQEIQQTFSVTPTNNIFTFQYLAVLQDGGHSATDQPYFSIQMLDGSNNVIPCTKDVQSASASIAGWTNCLAACSGSLYKGWKTVTIDLTSYISQNVTIQLIVSDCNQGGHYGYCYVDASCGQLNYTNNASICSGNNANLCGPPGYASYNWTGPATGSAQCLSTSSIGTYTLTTTSSLGCPSPVLTYTVSANPAVTPNFSVSTTPCNLSITATDLSTISSGSITNWSWSFGDGSTATSTTAGNTQAHTYTASGAYTVVMTCTSAAGCAGTFSTTVNLGSSLTSTVTSSAVSCNGGANGTATVVPSGGSGVYSYNWSPLGGTTNVGTGFSAGTTYTVSINDGAGCTGTNTVTVTQPTALSSTSSTVQTTCHGFNGSATISMSGGTGPYTYTWSPTGGNASTISGAAAGTYTCNITDFNNCTYSTSVTITDKPEPTITSITSGSVSCFGGSNGSATVVATGTGLGYAWSPAGGGSATASGLNLGTYTVTVTDVNGCTVSDTVSIAQPTDIVPTSSVTGSACGSATGSATVSATGGTGAYTYTWSPSPATGTANNASSLGAGTYNCVIKDANNCSKTVSVFITTTTGPTVTIAPTSSITCNGLSNGSASVTSVSGGTGALTYTWLPSPAASNTNTVNGLPAGTYTCVIQDAVGCFGSNTVTIVQPAPFTTPTVVTNVKCFGGSDGMAQVNVGGGTGPMTYTWVPSGGNAASTGTTLPMGAYTVNITDANSCTTTAYANITQPTALNATVATTSVICFGGLTGTSIVSPSGGTGAYTYAWAPAGGTNASAIGLGVGTYTTTIRDANLCTYTISSTVTGPTALTATVSPTNVSCFSFHDGSATVTASGGTGAYTYSWSPSGGTAATSTSTYGAGSYTSTVKDANGCFVKTTFAITAPPVITITAPTTTPVRCFGATDGAASVSASGGTPTYTVTWNTTPVQTGLNATNLPAGSYTATVTDSRGCSKTKKVIVLTPELKDSLTMTGSLCSTDPTVLLSAPTGTAINTPYQWYLNTSAISGATATTYSAIQASVNDYAVTWHHNGCVYVTTKVFETIFADISTLPQTNIFTPNGDGLNDNFYPLAASTGGSTSSIFFQNVNNILKEYELIVYDRWGILMYTTTDFLKPWAGKDAPDGTYYWIVNYKTTCNANAGRQKLKGFVQLLK
jgi:hypothetical protein